MIKAEDFASRNHVAVSSKEMEYIVEAYTYLDYKTIEDIDNPKYDWQMIFREGNDEKYGRIMISHSQKIRRRLTMGEFYGSGDVD